MEQLFKRLDAALALAGQQNNLREDARALRKLAAFQANRLGTDTPYLIVGILGPNNAGKSTFFTKMTGCAISPPAPDGGYTRHLAAAAHPRTLARVLKDRSFSGFRLVEVSGSPDEETRLHASPDSLYLTASERTPPHLVVIDSPDFDSIDDANHRVSESLTQIADLIVCIVTKHTYNNAKVHAVMKSAIDARRPYMVLYNEAMDANTAGRHLEALVADFSSAPHALCYAPSDVAVQDDPHVLRVLRLDDGQPFALEALTVADMKRLLIQANAAKLSALAYGARRLATEWAEQTGHLRLFMEDSEKAARQLGDSVAETCYPIGPLRDAFLNVLNERGEYHAYVRKPVQWTADGIVKASKGIAKATKWSYRYMKRRMGKGVPQQDNAQIIPKDASPEALLIEHERKAFEANWPDFVSAVERALKTAKLSHEERADYEAEFHPGRFPTIEHKILADMAHEPIPDDYVAFCEASMRNALETRGRDTDLQWFSTALAALPAVVGVVVVVATGGGFGSEDLAIAGVTTATAPVWDRLMKLVGKDVAQRVRDEWIRQRGARIAEAALEASAPATRKAWDETVRESDMRVPQLRDCARALLHRVKETNHDGE